MAEGPRKKQNPIRTGGGGPAPSLAERFRRGLTPKQIKICIAAIALLMAVIIAILVFAVACAPADLNASSSSWPLASSATSSASQDDSFDPDAFSRVVGEYAGVLLDETADAGSTYVEETLFIGDSNTARMVNSSVDEVTMKNAIGIESMGITSVQGLRCVRFSGLADMTIPSAVAVMQPKRIVINFGTNNAGMNTEGFIKSYRSAIEAIQTSWPYADIFIASVFPISQGCTYGGIKMSHIEEFNIALLDLAKEMELRFLNWSDALKDSASGYAKASYMVGDGVHLSEAGIQAVFEYFRTHSYEGEDTRPALKAVPTRLPTPEGLFPTPTPKATVAPSTSIQPTPNPTPTPTPTPVPVVTPTPTPVPVSSAAPTQAPTPEPVVPTPEPVVPTPEPVVPTPEPVVPTQEPQPAPPAPESPPAEGG